MPKQNLSDILGKSGDFKFSFAVDDLITPVMEKVNRIAELMMTFFKKASKYVDLRFMKAQKGLKKFLNKEGKAVKKVTKDVASGLKDVEKQTKKTGKEATTLTEHFKQLKTDWDEWQQNIASSNLKDALGELETGTLTESAKNFVSTMGDVASTLGKNRKEMGGLTEEIVRGIEQQSWFAASAGEAMDAVKGLTDAGVRSEEMLKDLGPSVAIAANAVRGDVGDISGVFYELNDRVGLTGDQINDVFANWKKTAETTAVDFKTVQDTFTNPEFYANFQRLTKGMSEDTRVQMLSTLGHIRGSFADEWADSSDFIGKIMDAMTDPRMAGQMVRLTGMTAEQVQAQLQTTEGAGQFFTKFMGHVERTASQGEGTIKQWEETMGFASGSLLELNKSSENIQETFKKLQEGQVAVGEGAALMTQRATENTSGTAKWGRALSHLAAKDLPLLGMSLMDRAAALADVPWTQIFAFGAVMSALAGTTLPAFAVSSGMAAAGVTSLGGAFTFAASGLWAILAPALPFIAAGAAIAAVVYLMYQNFDKLVDIGSQVYDFFMGTGPLEEGWLGTAQAFIRLLIVPFKVLYHVSKFLGEQFLKMGDAFLEWSGYYKHIDQMAEAFGRVRDFVQGIVELLPKIATLVKTALVGKLNETLINPLNAWLTKPIPLTGKTLGDYVGVPSIPKLAQGGVITSPTLAVVGDADEAVIPLDQYDRLLSAAAGINSSSASTPARSPNVTVAQDRVVAALLRLERVLIEALRRRDPPTRGSAFGASSAANPRGF